METAVPRKKRKKFYQADFLKRRALMLGALLFTVYQLVRLIRLFSDAIAYKKINQVVPEDFTMGAVTGAVIMVGLAAWIFVILYRQSKDRCLLRRGNRFLLLDLLLSAYGLARAIRQLILFTQNFEILFLADVLGIACGLIAPAIILFLADRQRIPPGDLLLMIIGGGGMGLSALGFVMVAISIGKDYTVAHALPELGFRLGVALCGLAALRTALKLHAEAPLIPVAAVVKPEKVKKPRREFNLHLKLLDSLPGYEDEEPEIQLFDDGEAPGGMDEPAPLRPMYEEEPETDALSAYEPYDAPHDEPEPEPVRAPRESVKTPVDENGRAACLGCGRRFPAYLGVCPHCGLDMDTPPPEAEDLAKLPDRATPAAAGRPTEPGGTAEYGDSAAEPGPAYALREQAARRRTDDNRATCAHCGRRYPRFLGVCPYCGQELGA